MARTTKILETVYHSDDPKLAHAGPAGDGSFTKRWRSNNEGRKEAEEFIKGKRYYAGKATLEEREVSAEQMRRYGL
jgi:hypothetical protein